MRRRRRKVISGDDATITTTTTATSTLDGKLCPKLAAAAAAKEFTLPPASICLIGELINESHETDTLNDVDDDCVLMLVSTLCSVSCADGSKNFPKHLTRHLLLPPPPPPPPHLCQLAINRSFKSSSSALPLINNCNFYFLLSPIISSYQEEEEGKEAQVFSAAAEAAVLSSFLGQPRTTSTEQNGQSEKERERGTQRR